MCRTCQASVKSFLADASRVEWPTDTGRALAAVLVVVGAVAPFLGARITSLHVPGKRLKQAFGVLIVIMTAYKLFQIMLG